MLKLCWNIIDSCLLRSGFIPYFYQCSKLSNSTELFTDTIELLQLILEGLRGSIHTQLATRDINLAFLFHNHPPTLEMSICGKSECLNFCLVAFFKKQYNIMLF